MDVKIIDSIEKFYLIKDDWVSLEKRVDDFQIFYSWDWAESYINNVLDSGDKLFIIMIYEKNTCIGIFPLIFIEREIELKKYKILTYLYRYSVDYNDIYIDKKYNKYSILKKLMNFIHENSKYWDMVELKCLNSRYGTIYLIQDIISKFPSLNLISEQNVITPYINLVHTNDKANLSNMREIRRKERKLRKSFGVDIKINSEFNLEVWNKFTEFHKDTWNDSMFKYNEVENFYKILAKKMENKNCLEFSYLTLDNECVAIHYGFKDENKIYYYIPVYSKKIKKNLSVGSILLYNIITYYKERGIKEFDFMRGNEAYKFDWTDSVSMNYDLTINKN
ncbi:GNAT family N-acetyltransferase [Peribacillus frigoritolerans]|uniref:GNAT family N-acetyltransferase n=1 Tax=Peribacillus frigoritolerans TaxID=450367 RepID=UPI00207AEAFE|nr:GNAT family N-acetyltransferase [Peribacillus frigoritolerans]USK82060.1 GNAT family N-acetyltransferase [Peribacillus frigoritolerans]WJE49352.1 GNAT family N-acetyltransferase [Peribacillus frigoritolerans]